MKKKKGKKEESFSGGFFSVPSSETSNLGDRIYYSYN